MVRNIRAGTLLVVDQALIKQVFEGITHRLTAHPKLQLQRPLGGQLIAGAAGDNVALLQQTNHLLILRPGHGRQCLSQQARLVGVYRVLSLIHRVCGFAVVGVSACAEGFVGVKAAAGRVNRDHKT